jgi:STE24 endopeptidase
VRNALTFACVVTALAGHLASAAEALPAAAFTSAAQQPFDPVAATEAYLAGLSSDARASSDAYFEGNSWAKTAGVLVESAVMLLLLFTGWSTAMRDRAERITRRKPLQTLLYWAQFLVVTTLLLFPLQLYKDFFREHQYGLSNEGFMAFLVRVGMMVAVGLLMLGPILVILYGVVRRAPRTWWLWGSGVVIAFLSFHEAIAPIYIKPLFSDDRRLEDPEIREPILRLLRANGIGEDAVYVVAASEQSKVIGASVSGFLDTVRIHLNDTLVARCTLPEIEAVLGHEIGHYVLGHSSEMILSMGVVIVIGFALVRWSFERLSRRWGIRGAGDLAGLPLALLLFTLYSFAMTPVTNTIFRSNEAEADLFGLNAARQPDGFAKLALKLGEFRKLDPGPIEEGFLFDHPSGRSRILMAMRWKAEHLDELTSAPAP